VKAFLIVFVVIIVLTIGGLVLLAPSLGERIGSFSSSPSGTPVRVEAAAMSTLVETIQAPGEIEPYTQVNISAQVSAQILELAVRDGDAVSKGDLLCKLDDRDVQAVLDQAISRRDAQRFTLQSNQTELDRQKVLLEFARRDLERVQQLYSTEDMTEADLDDANERVANLRASVDATVHSISIAEANLAVSESDIQRARDSLDNTVLTAPMDGIVTLVNVEVGEHVLGTLSNVGTHIMTIADFSRVLMNAEVAESDIAKVQLGQAATVYVNALPDDEFTGTVRQIALQRSISANGTGYFKVEIELDPRDKPIRFAGAKANADIEIASHEGLVVPYQAILVREMDDLPSDVRASEFVDSTKSKANVVFCMMDGKARCFAVKAGPSDQTHRLIEGGIDEGAKVIVGPYKVLLDVKPDDPVRLEEASDRIDSSKEKESADQAVTIEVD
jgi:HlyD family secretion protein